MKTNAATKLSAEMFAAVTREDLEVIVFHDAATHLRWFMRDHSVVGTIVVSMLDGKPVDPTGTLDFVRREFGPEAHVLWVG